MTHSEEAKQIVQSFFEALQSQSRWDAIICARLHVKKAIELFERNGGYTQCAIDKKRYQSILFELDNLTP